MKRLSIFLTLLVSAAGLLWSQAVNGTLLGTIQDQTGAVIANAKVTLEETRTAQLRAVQTNESGNYLFSNLPQGNYKVTVEAAGFGIVERSNIDVLVNSTVRVDLELKPGNVNEKIVVTAEAPILQTDRTDTGRKIETRQVSELPLPTNRNFQSLLNLVPGTGRAQRFHSEFFNSQDSLASRVNGQSRLANNVQFEGVDNNHRTGLLTVLIPPVEAIATVDITTSNYEAELGRAGGAVTNVVLKSGSNEIHGSVFAFNRVSALAARQADLSTKPQVVYNYYGFTLGGPIVKNKMFIFGDYLGVRDRLGFGQRLTIPQTPFRTGDLSAGLTQSAPQIVSDPRTGDASGAGRQPFAGNIIPANRISPISTRLLALIPAPTNAALAQNFERASTRRKDTDSFDVKYDWNISNADRLSVRYSFQEPEVFVPPLYGDNGGPSGPSNDGFAGTGTNRTQSAAVNYTRTFTPTLITEVRLGMSRYKNLARNPDYGTTSANAVGIANANLSEFTGGMVDIRINGYSGPVIGHSPSMPWNRFETNWNLVNNWTKIAGNHTIKFGFDARLNRDGLLQTQTFGPRGQFTFTPGPAALNAAGVTQGFVQAFGAFLLDVPNGYGRDLPILFPEYIQKPFFWYVQDTWQVSRKLTVNFGVRHELYPPAIGRATPAFSNYNPNDNTLVLAGVGNNPRNMGRQFYASFFSPRVGASYRLNDKTVIRAGYGFSYMPFPDNEYAYNFPVRQNNAFNAPNTFSAAGSMAAGFPLPQPAVIPSDGIIRNAPEQNYTIVPLDFREPYVISYNVAVQRSLPGNWTLEAAYVGNRGVRIPAQWNINAGLQLGAGQNGQPLFQRFGRRAATTVRFNALSSDYNSLQVKLDRRFSQGLQVTTAYTWSKAIDFSNDNGQPSYYIDPGRSRARADFDRRHVFVQSYIYELPFGRGRKWNLTGPADWAFGGWQMTGILTLMTGQPFNVTAPAGLLNAPGAPMNNPNLIAPVTISKSTSLAPGGPTWFSTSSFQQAPVNTFGTVGRNPISGPGFFNLDFSLFKKFQWKEHLTFELRAESFNFTNTAIYNNPVGDISSANFGRVTSVQGGSQRQIQLGMRVLF